MQHADFLQSILFRDTNYPVSETSVDRPLVTQRQDSCRYIEGASCRSQEPYVMLCCDLIMNKAVAARSQAMLAGTAGECGEPRRSGQGSLLG